jgi:hypothetical protein
MVMLVTDVVTHISRSPWKVLIIFVRFQPNLKFIDNFSKNPHIRIHENLSSGSQVVPRGWMDSWTAEH